MNKIILLVSLERLKSVEFGIDMNTDQMYIIPHIIKFQRYTIKPLLGDDYYNALLTYVDELKNGGESVVEYDDLIDDYIAPAIAYFVKSELVFSTAYKTKNNPQTPDGDRFNELVLISKKYLSDSDAFVSELKKYMCKNSITQDEDIRPRGCGINLTLHKTINTNKRNF